MLDPWKLFVKTFPFVLLKMFMSLSPLIVLFVGINLMANRAAGAVADIVGGVESAGLFGAPSLDSLTGSLLEQRDALALPSALMFVAFPMMVVLFRTVGRYLVGVGHIAVVTNIMKTGKVPEKQLSWGFGVVKKTFGRVTLFFFLSRIVHRVVLELQTITANMLAGFGPLVIFINLFKRKFIGYIDDCCLAYTYYDKELGPFRGAATGLVVYVNGWRNIARACLRLMFEMFVLGLVFYGPALYFAGLGLRHQELSMVAAGAIMVVVVRALSKCVLDSYAMISVLSAFLKEAERQGSIEINNMFDVATMSRTYNTLLYQANQEERFMDEQQAKEITVRSQQ